MWHFCRIFKDRYTWLRARGGAMWYPWWLVIRWARGWHNSRKLNSHTRRGKICKSANQGYLTLVDAVVVDFNEVAVLVVITQLIRRIIVENGLTQVAAEMLVTAPDLTPICTPCTSLRWQRTARIFVAGFPLWTKPNVGRTEVNPVADRTRPTEHLISELLSGAACQENSGFCRCQQSQLNTMPVYCRHISLLYCFLVFR